MKTIHTTILLFLAVFAALTMTCLAGDDGDRSIITSPDGNHRAEPTGSFPAIDYAVKRADIGETLFVTRFIDQEGNDLKKGSFSPDSRLFAALYMYEGSGMRGRGHKSFNHAGREGPTTWIGIWDIASGKRIMIRQVQGYRTDEAVFDWKTWMRLPEGLIRIDYDLCPIDHTQIDPKVREVFVTDNEEGTLFGSRTALVLSFCSAKCRAAFDRNTTAGVAAIKAMKHSEHPLTITNPDGHCPRCGKQALAAFFQIEGDEAKFSCSETCARNPGDGEIDREEEE